MTSTDRTRYAVTWLALVTAPIVLANCGPASDLEIVEPRRGRVVAGPDVTVRWRLHGTKDAASGSRVHLLLDRDLPPAGEPIPRGDPRIAHVVGDSTYTFEDVDPGPHRVTVVVGDSTRRIRRGFDRASVPFRVSVRP